MNDLTVFVVGDDELGTALREAFVAWADEGLVVPSAWVTPSSISTQQAGPPRVEAEVVGHGSRETGDLFRIVGRRRRDVVRVVAGQILVLGSDADTALLEAAQEVADALRDALPQATVDGGHSTALLRANVLAPVSGTTGVTRDAVVAGWDVNAVVSAEDRPDADHANVFVRHPGNAVGHAATALAAVGGVLAGVGRGAFDAVGTEVGGSSGGTPLELLRVHVRAVVGEDLESRLAARTLEAVAEDPSGPASFVEWARVAVDPDRIVGDLSRHLDRSAPWTSGRPVQIERSLRRRAGFGAIGKEALRFNVRTFGTVPLWALSNRVARLEDTATDVLVGGAGDTVVRLRPGTPEAVHAAAADFLHGVDERQRRDELDRESAAVALPDPQAWGSLRAVAFAAVDGQDLPADVPTPRYAGVREVLPPSRVVPDPEDRFAYRGASVPAMDPEAVRGLGRHLQTEEEQAATRLRDAAEAVQRAESALAAAEAEAAQARKAAEAGAPPEAASSGTVEIGEAAADQAQGSAGTTRRPSKAAGKGRDKARSTPEARAVAAAKADVQTAEMAKVAAQKTWEAAHGERERFGRWHRSLTGTVLWRLVDGVVERRARFTERYQQARAELGVDVPPHEALVAAQRRLVRRWRVSLGLWALATLFASLGLRDDDPPPEVWHWVGWLGGITLVAIGFLVWANHRFYKATRAYAWDVQQAVERRRQASEDMVFFGREGARLGQLYPTLVDWMTIIGRVLHHPRGSVPERSRRLDEDVVTTLPAAFAVARTAAEDDISKATVVRAIQWLHPAGWASRCFDDAYEAFQKEQLADGDESGFIAPDLDTTDSAHGPRRLLVDYWVEGGAAEVLTRQAVEQLRDAVHEDVITLPTRRVARLGPDGDGGAVLEPDFYKAGAGAPAAFVADMFSATARQDRKHYVARSVLWLPPVALGRAVVDDGVTVSTASENVALRVDLSRSLLPDDLVLFGGDGETFTAGADGSGRAGESPVSGFDDGTASNEPVFH